MKPNFINIICQIIIDENMSVISDLFQKDMIFTIKMEIIQITLFQISKLSHSKSITTSI